MKVEINVSELPSSLDQQLDNLTIVQTIEGDDSFSFEFKLSNDEQVTLDDLKSLMGAVIQIKLIDKGVCHFRGIVQTLDIDTRNTERWLTVSGLGLMGLLDTRFGNRAFANTTVGEVFKALVVAEHLSFSEEVANRTVTWAIQAGESDAAFLRRFAARHNLTCYSDGQQIVVRSVVQPIMGGTTLDTEKLDDFDTRLSCQSFPKATGWDYRSPNGDLHPMVITQASGNPLWIIAHAASAEHFGSFKDFDYGLSSQSRLNARQLFETGLLARTMHLVSAGSTDDRLRLGEVARFGLSPLIDKLEESRPYRIVAIKHSYDAEGGYDNIFEAIPADLPMQAKVPFFLPPQRFLATVTSDTDQQRLGRVTVELPFSPGVNSPLIPVLLSQKLHDIPTPGTKVVVECGGDDEDLMVTGTFYHAGAPNSWAPGAFGLYYAHNGFTVAANEGNVGVYVTGNLTLKSNGDTNIVCSGHTVINTQLDTTIKGIGILYLMP